MQKGQIWVVGTITFSAKRSNPPHSGCAVRSRCAVGTQYAVGISAKRSTPHTVGVQYAVGVSAKRSNMGDGDHYL